MDLTRRAFVQMIGAAAGSKSDPYQVVPSAAFPSGYFDLTGRTQVHPSSSLTTEILISWGQSLAGNNGGTGYSIVNAQNHNFCYLNGAVYQSLPRLLGCGDTFTQDNFLVRLADKIITAGSAQRVILAPFAADGSSIFSWTGELNARIGVMARRLASVGITATRLLASIGESDALAGTSQSAFASNLTSILNAFQSSGITCTAYIEKCTWISGSQPAGATAIRAAIDSVVNGTTIKAGPDTDTLNNTYRTDTTHWNATGSDAAAALWKTALGL